MTLVGRPPVPRAAIHLFLGDELRHPVLDRAAAILGQRLVGMGSEIIDVEILIADVGDEAAVRRDVGIGRKSARAGGDLGQGVRGGLGEIVMVEAPIEREQQRLSGGREGILEDAGERGRSLALAAAQFLGRQLLLRRRQHLRVDQDARGLVVEVVFPQVEAVLVVGLALKIGHARGIRRYLQPGDRRPRKRRCVEKPIDGELRRVRAAWAPPAVAAAQTTRAGAR